jgi:6-phosphogluconate dehydrogenase (decarboxylating)
MEQVENRTLDELKFGDTASLVHTLKYKKVQLREKGRGYQILIEKTRGLEPIRTAVVHPVDAVSRLLKESHYRRNPQASAATRRRSPATPLRNPEEYQYDLNLRDIAEVWRRGSVVASWLLDLTAAALMQDPELSNFAGRVSDSGEGRWTIKVAIDEAVPAPVLTTALYERFSSRGEADFANKLLSAMRYEFGGHLEKSDRKSQVA